MNEELRRIPDGLVARCVPPEDAKAVRNGHTCLFPDDRHPAVQARLETEQIGDGVWFERQRVGDGGDARVFAKAKIACMGRPSAGILEQFGITADFIPTVFTSAQLAAQLAEKENLKDKKILLFSSAITSGELAGELEKFGAIVDDVHIYTTIPTANKADGLIEKIGVNTIDWITFTSPSTVRCFFDKIPPSLVNSSRAKVASIGPVTSAELSRLGVKLDVQAEDYSIDGLMKAIEDFEKQQTAL